MTGATILWILVGYFALLMLIAWLTGRKAGNNAFFRGNRQSPWAIVAFGMIGASLSGVTFISVPGWVGTNQFTYMQMVLGYMVGYLVIALVLMPLYYALDVTSIYRYLYNRFGVHAYKTGAAFFLLSRSVGAAFRLFLVAGVLQMFVFGAWDVPFALTVALTIVLIWVYTFRGGIKTIVWTDALQTFFMLLAAGLAVVLIADELSLSPAGMVEAVANSGYAQIFHWEWGRQYFWVQFLNGAFIAVVMTGLDQDMMQKNLSIRSLKESQRNIFMQMPLFLVFNLLFLSLGALLYVFALTKYQMLTGIPAPADGGYPNEVLMTLADKAGMALSFTGSDTFPSDGLFPLLAIKYLHPAVGFCFVVGLIAAAYSSADSALTALTTSFCVDFLGVQPDDQNTRTRIWVHVGFSVVLLLLILLFNAIGNRAIIDRVFMAAGYTYGPLLGLFAVGLLTKWRVRGWGIPAVCLLSPLLVYIIKTNESLLFDGYTLGHEILLINGGLTMAGLFIISKWQKNGKSADRQ